MTTAAGGASRTGASRPAGPARSRGWHFQLWLFFIAFGVIPLLGVLGLSFTRWDGIGAIHPAGFASWRKVLNDPGLPHAL